LRYFNYNKQITQHQTDDEDERKKRKCKLFFSGDCQIKKKTTKVIKYIKFLVLDFKIITIKLENEIN